MGTEGEAVKGAKGRVFDGNSGKGMQSHHFCCNILWIAKSTSLVPNVSWASISYGRYPMQSTHLFVAISDSTWLSAQMLMISWDVCCSVVAGSQCTATNLHMPTLRAVLPRVVIRSCNYF